MVKHNCPYWNAIMDSELMHSIVGSYLKPPERMFSSLYNQNEDSSLRHHSMNIEVSTPQIPHGPNSQALILALRTLQEKIHRLELERTQAEDNLNILSREAAQYKKALENETNERNLAHEELIRQKKDISLQLCSAQSRCTILEKQLEYTKRIVISVEKEKNMILEQQAQLQREKEQDHIKLQAKLEKLDILEKECFKLTTTQKSAEDKIKNLEEKLKEEEHQRKLFQDKASKLQTGLEINRILMSSMSNPKCSKVKKKSSKKPAIEVPEPRCLYKPTRTTSRCKAVAPKAEKSISMCDNLSELLLAMQDELGQMNMEHRELLNQMKETDNQSVYEDIKCELEYLVKKIEVKEGQISRLKKHQDNVCKLQQKFKNSVMSETSAVHQENKISKRSKNIRNDPRKCLLINHLQKNSTVHPARVHNLQVKLRKDDIMWEQ